MARLPSPPQLLSAAPLAVGFSDRKQAERARDRARVAGDNLRKLYRTKRWRDPETGVRIQIATRDGWMCQGCAVPHQLTADKNKPNSLVVDHIEPHRGNLVLFWDPRNLQAVCKEYHDSEKQRQEHAALAAARKGGGGSNP